MTQELTDQASYPPRLAKTNIGAGVMGVPVKVRLKVLLQGCYNITDSQMHTLLEDNNYIPLISPYCEDPRTVSAIPDNITDWVLVQLSTSPDAAPMVSRSAFLRKDGYIIADDGITTILINAAPGSYYVFVVHRNHLTVMTSSAISLVSETATLYDFTTSSSKCYGVGGLVEIESGVWGMWAGDVNHDGRITTQDFTIWFEADRAGLSFYIRADINLDGSVDLSDYALWLGNSKQGATSPIQRTGDAALICASPDSLDYQIVATDSSADKMLSIANLGTTDLQITSMNTTDPDFTITGGTSFIIAPGGYQEVVVRFSPSSSKYYNNKLQIYNNSAESPIEIKLKGLGDGTGTHWVLITGGTFTMGDIWGDGESWELPTHQVSVNTFYLSRYEITNSQYANFLNAYGSETVKSGDYAGKLMVSEHDMGMKKSGSLWYPATGYENCPAIFVTWYGAHEYCRHYGFLLPSEAEWEYAARDGGQSYKWAGTSDDQELPAYAWYTVVLGSSSGTHSVGSKLPNGLGLYDMTGNVWEACQDRWHDTYSGAPTDGSAWEEGDATRRVFRGGCWGDKAHECRTPVRLNGYTGSLSNDMGFRPVFLP